MDAIRIFPAGEIFHICNKSIAGYEIFRTQKLVERFINALSHYNNSNVEICLSRAVQNNVQFEHLMHPMGTAIVKVLAYCIMPDHYHVLVKTKLENELSLYMSKVENSYSRYFNKVHDRKGPLWQSTFRSAHILDNETLLHVHRYIHLNPTTAGLVDKPADWPWSSYQYFITNPTSLLNIYEISIRTIKSYQIFVEEHQEYQKKIKYIQKNFLD